MSHQKHVWRILGQILDDILDRHRRDIGIDQTYLMPCVDQGPTNVQKAKGR